MLSSGEAVEVALSDMLQLFRCYLISRRIGATPRAVVSHIRGGIAWPRWGRFWHREDRVLAGTTLPGSNPTCYGRLGSRGPAPCRRACSSRTSW